MITIRHATIEDYDAIHAIEGTASKELGSRYPSRMKRSMSVNRVHVATIDNVVCGFVEWNDCTRGENKNWNVIYKLAVHPDYYRLGIGKRLLYSVPCPIRLYCVTGTPANKFYQDCGMDLVYSNESLNKYEMQYLYILHKGSKAEIVDYASKMGWAYGSRSDAKAYAQPFMVDIDWNKADWKSHLEYVKKWQPVMSMVIDYEVPDKDNLLQQIQDLRDCGVMRVMVCPKFEGATYHIPDDCIVSVSVPTKHAGYLPAPIELIGRKLHLLGGHPDQWHKLIHQTYPLSTVISMDSFHPHEKAVLGSWWSIQRRNWRDRRLTSLGEISSITLAKMSARTIRKYLFLENTSYDLPRSDRINVINWQIDGTKTNQLALAL